MKNFRIITAGITLTLLGTLSAHASDRQNSRDGYDSPSHIYKAKIVEVRPMYRYVRVNRPNKRCRYESRTHEHRSKKSSVGSTLLGGVIGGAIGSRVGKGKGRDAATILGAIIGAKVANDRHNQRNPGRSTRHSEEVRVCRRVNNYYEERRQIGFRVKYRYRGDIYTTKTQRHPGRRLRLRVRVTPDER